MPEDRVDLTGIGARLLPEELVAGEAQDTEGLASILLCQCIERVVLGGVASEGGQVHNKEHLSSVVGQGNIVLLLNILCGELV